MRLETFFEKFEQFAETPNAVAKMRELFLGLAVRGMLVKQDPNDEPASELLKQIYAAKSGRKFCSESSEDSTTSDSNYPFSVPSAWHWVGATFPAEIISDNGKKVQTKDVLSDGAYPVVDQGKVFVRGYCNDPEKVIEVTKPIVLFGDHTRETKLIDFDFVVGADGVKLLQPLCIDPFYYYLTLRWLPLDSRGYGRHFKLLKAAMIPLPPLAEQKRIVAKVDELMALCDQLELQQQDRATRYVALVNASLARFTDAPTPANLNVLFNPSYAMAPADLRKIILNLAVQGKLVPQNLDDEPASTSVDLVSKDAKKAIRDGIIRRHGLAELVDDSELPELPLNWRWSRLAEVTRPVPYAIKRGPFGSAIRKDMFVPEGFKVYEQQHAISGDFTKGRYYITPAKFEELRAFELHPNEILVSCSGTVGKVAVVPTTIERGVINQALLKLSLHQSALLNEYFIILFPAFFMETDTLTNLQGTAQKNIPGMDVLRELPFPLPPLAEQRRIVAKVDQLMALADQLETQLAASRTAAINLMEAVVAELTTAQDNADSSILAGSSFR